MELHIRLLFLPCQREAHARQRIAHGVERAHLRRLIPAKADHLRLGMLRHRAHIGVVVVEDGDAIGGERLHNLALAQDDVLQAAEILQMLRPNDRHHTNMRRRNPAEQRHLADTLRAHLQHGVTGAHRSAAAASAARRPRY